MARLDHRLVCGASREDGDTRGVVGGLMAGSPVDGGPLHKAETQTLVGDDGGGARGLTIHARSGACNADAFESSERRPNRLLAIVHVVGIADGMKPADDQGLGGGARSVKALAFR